MTILGRWCTVAKLNLVLQPLDRAGQDLSVGRVNAESQVESETKAAKIPSPCRVETVVADPAHETSDRERGASSESELATHPPAHAKTMKPPRSVVFVPCTHGKDEAGARIPFPQQPRRLAK